MPTDPMAGDVAANMERIFKPLAGRALVAAFHHDSKVDRAGSGSGWRRVTLAAPAAVFLVTATLAIGYVRLEEPAARTAEVTVAAPRPSAVRSSTAPSVAPTPTPSATSLALTVAPATAIDTAVVTSVSPIDPRPEASSISAFRTPEPMSTPNLQPRSVEATLPSATPSARLVAAKAATPLDSARADPAPVTPRCTPDSLDDHCIYRDVLNADLKLRIAYDDAKRGGVSKLFLSAVTRRWNKARKDADYSPDETIRRYERLAEALDEQRRDIAR